MQMHPADAMLLHVDVLESRIRGLEKELAFYRDTEKGKLRAAYIRLRTFAQLVSDFCSDDSAGHMRHLKYQAELAMKEAMES